MENEDKIDAMAQNLVKARHARTIRSFEKNIEAKTVQINGLSDTLKKLRREYKVYNINAQTETLISQYDRIQSSSIRNKARLAKLRETKGIPRDTIRLLEALTVAMNEEIDSLEAKIQLLNNGMPIVNLYEKQFFEANESLSQDKERLKEFQAAIEAEIPAIMLIEEGAVPVVKSRPRRSILVIAAGIIAFFFSVFGVLLFDAYDQVNWEQVLQSTPKK